MPARLVAAAERDGRQPWLATIPDTVARLERDWSIEVGPPFDPGGTTAWVAPARPMDGAELVLKVGWRHPEAEHEADGLRAWAGRGAVRLHRAADLGDVDTIALLLERCRPGTMLASRIEAEQDMVVSDLLRRLWIEPPPGHSFRPLGEMCELWMDELRQKWAERPSELDPGLARAGAELFRSLPDTADRNVLLCTDLHAGNVLAADRNGRHEWLVIDPKPYVGDPTYDPLQHMLNCEQRLRADPRGLSRHLAGLLDLDPERLVLWLFARCVQESPDRPGLADVARRLAP